jgi:hypothetical protein
MRKVGMAKEAFCHDCMHNDPGIYYDWRNIQTEETKLLCETCHDIERQIKENE